MPKLEVVASKDGVWSQLRASAEEAARGEPHLGSLMNATILSHLDLANALRLKALALDALERSGEAVIDWTEARRIYADLGVAEGVAECDARLSR